MRSDDRGSTIVTSNLLFDEWTGVFASERLIGAPLDRLTHHVHILEMNGECYRLKQSKRGQPYARAADIPERPPDRENRKCMKAPTGAFMPSAVRHFLLRR